MAKLVIDRPGLKAKVTLLEFTDVEFPDGSTRDVYWAQDEATGIQTATGTPDETYDLMVKTLRAKKDTAKL